MVDRNRPEDNNRPDRIERHEQRNRHNIPSGYLPYGYYPAVIIVDKQNAVLSDTAFSCIYLNPVFVRNQPATVTF